ncbi:MAG TPA: hypothetical protein VM012_09555 [Flavitalea sp.]|nr:hypothetical protein [Flavitalea sp.]
MKKLFVIICSAFLVTSAFAADVNEKVLRSFRQTFTNAESVRWEEFKTYYTVSFSLSGIQSKINYDKEGIMLGSIRYYAPQMLPLNIFNKLKKDYPKDKLFGVTEVTFGDEVAYFVKIETEKNWLTLKVDAAGNSEVHEKFKKA